MNPVPSFSFPGSRTVAAWWRELSALRPRRIWLSHLLLHRVEALTRVRYARALGELQLEVLRSFVTGHLPSGLEPRLCARLTRVLQGDGLCKTDANGTSLTSAGRRAAAEGAVDVALCERRVFYFVDNRPVERAPHFLRAAVGGEPVHPPQGWEFDPLLLQAALDRDANWKSAFRFPRDVIAICRPDSPETDWKSIILDQAEHLFAVFVETESAAGAKELRAFAAHTDGWSLRSGEPAIVIGEGWIDALPDLATDPGAAEWRAAWQAWGQQYGLPSVDTLACSLEWSDHRLQVRAPGRLIARLREIRSDALKGQTWLLAGSGRSRSAACVEIAERVPG